MCPGPNVSGNGGNLPGSDSAEDGGLERTGITMDGKAEFQFAVRKVPEVIREVLDANGLSADDIDWFILHQANRRIVESVQNV